MASKSHDYEVTPTQKGRHLSDDHLEPVFLVGDIGGTNARLALYDLNSQELSHLVVLSADEHDHFESMIQGYIREYVGNRNVQHACFAVASPVVGDHVRFTNNPWSFSISGLKERLGLKNLYVINDFVAVAHSLPVLSPSQLLAIHAPSQQYEKKLGHLPLAVLGPGTGLGIAAFCSQDSSLPFVLPTEGGHAAFAPTDALEASLLDDLRGFSGEGFVSREDLLSGDGILRISESLARLEGVKMQPWQAASDVTAAAFQSSDPFALRVMDLFCAILGGTAGDVGLQMGAIGGVFIAGGIVPRFPEFLLKSRFVDKFLSKGRYRSYMEQIPCYLITYDQPGLLGAARFCSYMR